MGEKVRYLFIGAHPDDIDIWAGGFLLKLRKKEDVEITSVVLTDGTAGTGGYEVRKAEAERAAEFLNVDNFEYIGLKDGSLCMMSELPIKLANFIRKYKPDMLLTHTSNDRHPDHAAIGRCVKDALFLATVSTDGLEYEPYLCNNALLFTSDPTRMPDKRLYVDISDVYEEKAKLINIYESQLWVIGPYLQLNQFYGQLIGLKAAEVFEVYQCVYNV
ncbi:MAG: PIG-L family deacetylase [Fervidobacterium sp.]|nr:PIG-L family deacetylase [Fervidobacterium sp.]HPT59758.1 PIG-L family deacetylase [Fervidobacterium sp.]HPZ18653.1 PIG-L family deacetylase [Fervidobacterium sp.]HQE49874.1 PIG-L family deacetylase [Fervidobacterium sp.]